jgi:hypothetical protein
MSSGFYQQIQNQEVASILRCSGITERPEVSLNS